MSKSSAEKASYKGKLKDSLFWWLGTKRPFYANDDYKIELIYVDREHNSAKIKVTNLKNGDVVTTGIEEVVNVKG
jgi:hypothetical protein